MFCNKKFIKQFLNFIFKSRFSKSDRFKLRLYSTCSHIIATLALVWNDKVSSNISMFSPHRLIRDAFIYCCVYMKSFSNEIPV